MTKEDSLNNHPKSETHLNVLMYHSISTASGPTSIPPERFEGQIGVLASCGYRTISLSAFKAWHSDGIEPTGRCVLITFDDGFADFAETAFPILKANKFTATVFLPSGRIGKVEDWKGTQGRFRRRLMDWSKITELAQEDIDFGGHSVTHTDLTKLPLQELKSEIRQCRDDIEQRLCRVPIGFAPPYGRAGDRERAEIRKLFDLSLGTKLGRANRLCDRFDIPRIEMHYFRDLKRWQDFLEGRAESYLTVRRALRGIKRLLYTH
jgi:peptidoglycan/xylan/chitin deacetylase (PgdA/CDA1 family)